MATLEGAIHELVAVVGAVDGIQYAPDELTERISNWPVAMVYATDGSTGMGGNDIQTDLHNIQIAVIMPQNDMRQQSKTIRPLYEKVTKALFQHRNGRTNNHYDTFAGISYTLGPIEWPSGELWYGFVFTIEQLKIQNTI